MFYQPAQIANFMAPAPMARETYMFSGDAPGSMVARVSSMSGMGNLFSKENLVPCLIALAIGFGVGSYMAQSGRRAFPTLL